MILRTYMCGECGYGVEVELRAEQWDQPPPECPRCRDTPMGQEFAMNIGGSVRSRATDLALDIAEKDYGVADIQLAKRQGDTAKVRYQDTSSRAASTWGAQQGAIEQAIALGKQTRLQHGSALDIIKEMPDLIELSKRRSGRVW